jgi:hypothetical protein
MSTHVELTEAHKRRVERRQLKAAWGDAVMSVIVAEIVLDNPTEYAAIEEGAEVEPLAQALKSKGLAAMRDLSTRLSALGEYGFE